MNTAPTLTAGAEAGDVIAVTFESPAERVQQYIAEIIESATGLDSTAAVFSIAETGVGAEVSTTAMPKLIFTTDANGDATLSVTDVGGASSLSCWLKVSCLLESADDADLVAPVAIELTFDGA
jgi:hypothetical protein